MKTKDVTQILKTLGWRIDTDEVGDKVALFKLPDRVVDIIYGIDQLIEDQVFSSTLSLSTDAFAKACAKIHPDRRPGSYAPLIRARPGLHFRAPEVLEEHIKQLSDQTITWAKEQDLTAGLQANVDLPTDAPGARPIWHLAALAITGNMEKLKSYQASFAAGDRLGFVPYITKDYIDRAIAFAEEYAPKST